MTKYFYYNESETGRVSYTVKRGVPKPLNEDLIQNGDLAEGSGYIIGIITKQDGTETDYYKASPDKLWGVKSFIE